VCRSRSQRDRRNLTADISYRGFQNRTKFGTSIEGALLYIGVKNWTLVLEVFPGRQNIKGYKKLVTLSRTSQ